MNMSERKLNYQNLHNILTSRLRKKTDAKDKLLVLSNFFQEKAALIDLYESYVPIKEVIFLEKDIDRVAEKLLPSDEICYPINCKGDGNCLYNSISLLICGNYNLVLELRLKTVREMLANKELYDTNILNNYSGSCKNMEEDILKTVYPGKYSGLRHVAALSNLMKISIKSIYPKVIPNFAVRREDLHTTFGSRFPENISIMWTHTSNIDISRIWQPNHFVPCVSQIASQRYFFIFLFINKNNYA